MKTAPYFEFIRQFFLTNGCSLLEQSTSHIKIQLTSDLDEEIMNRPFYWHYIKKMGRPGDPMQLTFTDINENNIEGIYLHAGTPKLHTIYETAMKKGKTARLYEAVNKPLANGALHPWLVVNLVLHFRGKQTKDEHVSLGLNLINGTYTHHMMKRIETIDFRMTVSDFTFPVTPLIGIPSAYKRMEGYIEKYTASLDHTWAKDSITQLREEEALLQSFFESDDLSEERFKDELDQLQKRYQPRIIMEVVNGGLFYLTQQKSQDIAAS